MYNQLHDNESRDRTVRIIINQDEVVRLPDNARWLRTEFGHIWLTDGPRDVVLGPGRTYNPDLSANTVVSALDSQPAGLAVGVPGDKTVERARARLNSLVYNRP